MPAVRVMRPDRVKGGLVAVQQETLATASEAVQAGQALLPAIVVEIQRATAVGILAATAGASRIAAEPAAETWRAPVEARAAARFSAARFL